ncbi:hypothetical protein [Actinoplanes sp. M2I2]|uniref:hypothetical protein n=1 Tax=Actinoplanes sp. M2I2 TaxID=1734444 RepID=UPI002021EFCA|nr:hypothetical protein [Actinoplanes sp. M2I2]
MTRLIAVVAPALMLVYGLCRYADGLDGDRGNGWAWDAGHVAFFIAVALFAVLADRLRRELPSPLTVVAEAVTIVGAAGMLWVITGDLFDSFPSLPLLLNVLASVLFEVGLLVLLVRHAVARRLPAWSPVLVLLGFTSIALSLDLLPLSAVLVGAGLLPLARDGRRLPAVVGERLGSS